MLHLCPLPLTWLPPCFDSRLDSRLDSPLTPALMIGSFSAAGDPVCKEAVVSDSFTVKDTKHWSVEEVKQWAHATLEENQLEERYIQQTLKALDEQGINGTQLLNTTKEELIKLYGIPGGPAGYLMDAIGDLSKLYNGKCFGRAQSMLLLFSDYVKTRSCSHY